jgi:hypothetical protein
MFESKLGQGKISCSWIYFKALCGSSGEEESLKIYCKNLEVAMRRGVGALQAV